MGKLNSADISNIKAYLSYDNSELKAKVVYQLAFFNILIPFIGCVYVVASLFTWVVAFVISIICIVFMIYFKVKVSPTQKQINLYYAIAWMFMSVNLCYVSCAFFSQTAVSFLIPLLIYTVAVPLLAFLMVRSECKKILAGFHKEKKFVASVISSAATFSAGLGLLFSRFIKNQLDENIVLGICCGFLGIIFSFSSRFFVKWYCYSIVEKSAKTQSDDSSVIDTKRQ